MLIELTEEICDISQSMVFTHICWLGNKRDL